MTQTQKGNSVGSEAKATGEMDQVADRVALINLAKELGKLVGRSLAKQEEGNPTQLSQLLDKGR